MDKERLKHLIEVDLIALRCLERRCSPWTKDYSDDPFILYQEGVLSKRKLISIIAENISNGYINEQY